MTVSGRLLALTLLLPLAAACSSSNNPSTPTTSTAPYSQTDLVVGTGATALSTSRVTVSYTGWLYDTSKTDGKGTQFDTNPNATFALSGVIAGWQRGVPGMKVGGTRRLIVPPDLAYGSTGSGPIPPNATLIFDIGLLAVQ
jgi:FKBP-type peptidyl-prolyl cis-trans isomerase FkpA